MLDLDWLPDDVREEIERGLDDYERELGNEIAAHVRELEGVEVGDNFNPDQPRDPDGKFASGGGSSAQGAAGPKLMGSGKNKERVAAAVASVPDSHRAALADSIVVNSPTVRNSQGKEVAGLIDEDNFIRIADSVKGAKPKDLEGTVVHEIGHALDRKSGDRLSREFASSVLEDSRRMSEADRSSARHYLSNEREMFAELYRLAYSKSGKGAFAMGQKTAERVFARSLEKIRGAKIP